MASDGKVIICTELDNSGIERGLDKISGQLSGLEKMLKSIADTVVKAFAFDKIKDFATSKVLPSAKGSCVPSATTRKTNIAESLVQRFSE